MTSENTSSTVFDETTPSESHEQSKVTPSNAEPDAPTLKALVGDGKKFKTVEDLAKSKLEADNFINRLQEEKKELVKDLEARMRTEEAVEALKQAKGDRPATAPDAVDIKRVVEDTISQVERDKVALANIRQVNAYLIDKLGGKAEAESFIAKKSEELGIPSDWLKDMAARSPKALYNTLGVDAPVAAAPTGSSKSDVNTEAKAIHAPSSGSNKAYFEALRKEKPSVYWSTKVQNEIFEATKKGLYK